jgi:hypothetical protein
MLLQWLPVARTKWLAGFLGFCWAFAFAAVPTGNSGKASADTLEVMRFIDDYETCAHLAGEINGDGSPEDQKASKNLNLACGRADKKWLALRKKYAKDPVARAWLDRYNLNK